LSTPFSFTWSFVACQVLPWSSRMRPLGRAAGRRFRGCGGGRPDRVRARVLDGLAGGTGPAGPAGRSCLAADVIARALREAPPGHKYDRVLTAKMTVICVLVACLFPGAARHGARDGVRAACPHLRPGTEVPTGAAFLAGPQASRRAGDEEDLRARRRRRRRGPRIGLLWKGLEVTGDGLTFLFVEHDMDVVMNRADHVVVMAEGAVIAAGAPEAVRADPRVIAAYLGRAAQ